MAVIKFEFVDSSKLIHLRYASLDSARRAEKGTDIYLVIDKHLPLTAQVEYPLSREKLAKISSPVESYTPTFVAAENDQVNKSLLTKYRLFPSPLNFLT